MLLTNEELRERQIAHIQANVGRFRQVFGGDAIHDYFKTWWGSYERSSGMASLYLTICADIGIEPKKECTKRVY